MFFNIKEEDLIFNFYSVIIQTKQDQLQNILLLILLVDYKIMITLNGVKVKINVKIRFNFLI